MKRKMKKTKPPVLDLTPGPDWYCGYCDKMVPNVDQRNGKHNERKGGCGNPLSNMPPVKIALTATCECGWRSTHFTSLSASAAFQNHQEECQCARST